VQRFAREQNQKINKSKNQSFGCAQEQNQQLNKSKNQQLNNSKPQQLTKVRLLNSQVHFFLLFQG
jgi:hypothetical protein